MQDSQVWPTMAANHTLVLHIEYIRTQHMLWRWMYLTMPRQCIAHPANVSRAKDLQQQTFAWCRRCSWELWSPLISFFHALWLKIPASREVESLEPRGAAVPVSCLLSFMRGDELSRACWATHAKFYPLTSRIYVKSINVVRVISQIQETRYLELTM